MTTYFKGLVTASLLLAAAPAQAQTFGDYINKGKDILNNNGVKTGGNSGVGNLSSSEIVQGLKEALNVGAKNASGRLGVTNGFFGNQLIKVLMPPEARKVESTLRQLGMGDVVDKAILSMNRAAEDAATKVVPIFANAITSMSIQDGVSILRGGNGAATNYLKGRTTASLTTAFRPVIDASLGKVGATKYWAEVMNIYNRLPTVRQKINPDLTAYVTERALNGLFITIADEENKIRSNPAARVSDILKKVFGSR